MDKSREMLSNLTVRLLCFRFADEKNIPTLNKDLAGMESITVSTSDCSILLHF